MPNGFNLHFPSIYVFVFLRNRLYCLLFIFIFFLDWHKDFMADPKTPVTKEEREKAAHKYNLHPSEYEPYKDDGFGWGDYPKLPDVPQETRSQYYPWDMPEHKKNFGEPLHINYPLWSEDRYGIASKPRFSEPLMYSALAACLTLSFLLYFWFDGKKFVHPISEKQYPNTTRYSFEPAK